MRLAVNHVTTYTYAKPARGVIQLLRGTPLELRRPDRARLAD